MNKFEEKKAKKEMSKETNSNNNDSISRNNSYYQNQFLSESINNENSFSNILNTNPSIVLPSLTLTNESSHKNRSKGSILFDVLFSKSYFYWSIAFIIEFINDNLFSLLDIFFTQG